MRHVLNEAYATNMMFCQVFILHLIPQSELLHLFDMGPLQKVTSRVLRGGGGLTSIFDGDGEAEAGLS